MGYYINPPNGPKELWLMDNGRAVKGVPSFDKTTGYLPVCLVNNGYFTAAGICYSNSELIAFNQPSDTRPKEWFLVPIEKLIAVCPELTRAL